MKLHPQETFFYLVTNDLQSNVYNKMRVQFRRDLRDNYFYPKLVVDINHFVNRTLLKGWIL